MKPEKIRLVWDAAARVEGSSLNDHLLSGPDLNEPLIRVLQRFRQGVAIVGGIGEMFHQVAVAEKNPSAMRFLWRDDEGTMITIEMCVLLKLLNIGILL